MVQSDAVSAVIADINISALLHTPRRRISDAGGRKPAMIYFSPTPHRNPPVSPRRLEFDAAIVIPDHPASAAICTAIAMQSK